MGEIIPSNGGATIRGDKSDERVTVRIDSVFDETNAGVNPLGFFHEADINELVSVGGTTNNGDVVVGNIPFGTQYTLINDTPTVCEIVGNTLEYRQSGTAEIRANAGSYGEVRGSLEMDSTVQSTHDVVAFSAGSLSLHVKQAMDTFISDKTPGDNIQNYVTAIGNDDVENPDVTINPSLFTNGDTWDWSGISVLRSNQSDSRYPVTMVLPNFALVAWHVVPPIGTRVVFKRNNGSYQTVTVTDIRHISVDGDFVDFGCVYFSEAVTGVANYKLFPTSWGATYAPYLEDRTFDDTEPGIVTFHFKMHRLNESWGSSLQMDRVWNISNATFSSLRTLSNTVRSSAGSGDTVVVDFDEFTNKVGIGGDSGSPTFIIVNDDPVYITSQTNETSGANAANYINEIEAAFDAMAGGTNIINIADLSSFTSI